MIKGVKSNILQKNITISEEIEDEIVIVGVNVELNHVNNEIDYWETLINGIEINDGLSEKRKKIINDYSTGIDVEKIAGNYLTEIDEFDCKYFNITPREAELMNPIQRRILHSVRGLFDNSGYTKESIYGEKIGVYLGIISDIGHSKYRDIIKKNDQNNMLQLAAIGNLGSATAGRISYFWNFTGPCISIDTACSSSLVALQNACDAIRRKECSAAVVVSANMDIIPGVDEVTLGFESESSHTRPFSENADGTSFGEGVFSVLLKPLSKAKKDKDTIYAIVKGGAINQDGYSMGLTVPNSSAQALVLQNAWDNARINPMELSYIEAHGTGTKIGDPIEIAGINTAFSQYADLSKVCTVGSVKANIGHLYAAAGLASVVKCALIIKNRMIPPSINFEIANKKIDFDNSYVYVSEQAIECDQKEILCGISSFGLSGTNCHVVLGEYTEKRENENSFLPFTISGKNEELLKKQAKDYLDFIDHQQNIQYADLCYTSCVGRTHQTERRITFVNCIDQIKEFLLNILDNKKDNYESLDTEISSKYLSCEEINWEKLFVKKNVRRIYIPGPHYELSNCWIGEIDNIIQDNKIVYETRWIEEEFLKTANEKKVNRMLVVIGDIHDSKEEFSEVGVVVKYFLNHKKSVYEWVNEICEISEKNKIDEIIFYYTENDLKTDTFELLIENKRDTLDLLFIISKSLHKMENLINIHIVYRSISDIKIFTLCNPFMEMLKGFIKSINKECGYLFARLTYLDSNSDLNFIAMSYENEDFDGVAVYYENKKYVEVLTQNELSKIQNSEISFNSEDAYIITGGLGAIGLKIALELAKKSFCHLLLIGRRSMTEYAKFKREEIENIIEEIKKTGSTVTIVNGDIAEKEFVDVLEEIIQNNDYKINGIFHCAGNAGKGFLMDKTLSELHNVTNPKIEGTWNLLQIKKRCKAKFMVCFSSEATLMTLPGQSDYLAGNSFMNACSDLSENVMTICWPAWSEIGMAVDNDVNMNTFFDHIATKDGINWLFDLLNKRFEVVYVGTMTNDQFAIKLANVRIDKSIQFKPSMNNESQRHDYQVILEGREDNNYTENEIKLATVWGEVLGLHCINIHDSFYAMGGDSIFAAQIIKIFSNRYGIMLAIGDIMSTPNIFDIAKKIDANKVKKEQEIYVKEREIALSNTQKRIYMASLLGGDSDVSYNLPKLFKLNKNMEINKLEKAFMKVIQRHEILRTSFHEKDGDLKQQIHDKGVVEICERAIDGDIYEEIKNSIKPFKLSELPLMRVELIHGTDEEYLFIDMHHIIVDGTSAVIMLHEVMDYYFGQELPALNLQYQDYVNWYQNKRETEYFSEAEVYWTKKLTGKNVSTSLSNNKNNSNRVSNRGKQLYVSIPFEIRQIAEKYAQKHDGTVSMVYLMALYVVLYRFTNDRNLAVIMPTAGRMNLDFDSNIGSFINLAPLNVEISDKCVIDELFEAVKSNIINAISYQEYAYEDIMTNCSKKQLINIMYSYLNIEQSQYNIHGINIEQEDIFNGCAKYEIALEVINNEKGVLLRWEYMTDLISDEKISSINDVFLNVLRKVNENEAIDKMEVCEDVQLQMYNKIYNNTSIFIDYEKTITDLFEENLGKMLETDAIICGGIRVSYAELNEKANQYARLFKEFTNKENPTILILLGRTEKLIECLLASLKLGAAYIPVDPNYPQERIEYIIGDSEVDILVTDKLLTEGFENDYPVLKLENQEEKFSKENLNIKISSQNDAYRIYTSGSTGKPKGVKISYKALTNLVLAMINELPLEECYSILNITTISFDIFVVETFVPLLSGKTIVLAQESEQLDMIKLSELILKNSIDFIQMTPSRANLFLNYCNDDKVLSDVKVILLGGEVVPKTLVDRIKSMTKARIYNVYGPTETTVWSSISELTNKEDVDVGHFISNTQGYIINSEKRLQPIGGIGELCIAGDGISSGYVNQEKLTKDRFIENPYSNGCLMYRTGDLAYVEDKCIHILGRIDSQVKVRGYRIELEEIENNINKIEEITEVAVNVQKDPQGDFLVCYYVSKTELNGDFIRSELGKKLPDYMIPSYYKKIEKISYTPNSKIDRKNLPEFKKEKNNCDTKDVIIKNSVEQKIFDIWAECLGHTEFGINDNYFDVGGTSISVIKMHSLINKTYPGSFEVTDLFQYSTIREISDKLLLDENKQNIQEHLDLEQENVDKCDIAIIGLGANLPKCNSIEEFWEKLCNGNDFIGELDERRKKEVLNYVSYVRLFENREIESTEIMKGAYLEDIDNFDYQLFKLSPKEARLMDPNQRLLLHVINETIEDAGYGCGSLKGTRTGVYIGNSDDFGVNYKRMLEASFEYHSGSLLTGNIKSVLAGRISYLYDLKGPSIVVDTACSSSLVAIDIACQDIRSGKCNQAIVGASNLILVPLKNEQKIGIESSDGKTKTFDNSSDGTGVGEGVVAVMLKPIEAAKKDHDQIYAVIKGSATNQDGRSIGLTAPNADSQTKVILQACNNANINIDSIRYFESHGTGTNLGDPIEIQGITNAFRKYTNRNQICPIGSVKTNLGHLDNCAGITGLLKTVLMLKYKKIPPILHFTEPNEKIDFIQSPVYVNDILRDWKSEDIPRRAAVNAFGLSGTNCCVILEEATEINVEKYNDTEELFTLSAQDEMSLRELVKQYIDVIKIHKEYSLEDICYTANTKRNIQNSRLAFIVDSKETLIEKLQNYLLDNCKE